MISETQENAQSPRFPCRISANDQIQIAEGKRLEPPLIFGSSIFNKGDGFDLHEVCGAVFGTADNRMIVVEFTGKLQS